MCFREDIEGLLLPEGYLPAQLVVFEKYAAGITAQRTYDNDFSRHIYRAFQVPDHQLPERIVLRYQTDVNGLKAQEIRSLSPAAYAIIPYRRAIQRQVQQVCGWLGVSLVLLPVLVFVLVYSEQGWLSAAVGAVVWVSFGLNYTKDADLFDTWQDGLRHNIGGIAFFILLLMLWSAAHQAALAQDNRLIGFGAVMGVVAALCGALLPQHPFYMMVWCGLAGAFGTGLAYYNNHYPAVWALPPLLAYAACLYISHRTLRQPPSQSKHRFTRVIWSGMVVVFVLFVLSCLF